MYKPEHRIYQGKTRFIDNSSLSIFHHVLNENGLLKFDYRFHYMDSENTMIFRYNNAPHYPEVKSFPHHKHTFSEIEEYAMPNIRNILSEIHHHIIKGLLSILPG
ncbi:DUF6516 family protein [Candidatus Kuenenia sp.]|uniref:toxin-antitoxin system TumE family protein n=1 Tax=Candidatus Kuenenia sp. TaxID=2499824 RepID=UPI00321FF513